jgi:hypothetical protein
LPLVTGLRARPMQCNGNDLRHIAAAGCGSTYRNGICYIHTHTPQTTHHTHCQSASSCVLQCLHEPGARSALQAPGRKGGGGKGKKEEAQAQAAHKLGARHKPQDTGATTTTRT